MELNKIEWGDDSAEKDADLLSYFVDTESYGRCLRKNKSIVVGRKGSGKSALRKKLEDDFSKQEDTHVNRHQFARHLSAIQNGNQRGIHEQQALSRRIQD